MSAADNTVTLPWDAMLAHAQTVARIGSLAAVAEIMLLSSPLADRRQSEEICADLVATIATLTRGCKAFLDAAV